MLPSSPGSNPGAQAGRQPAPEEASARSVLGPVVLALLLALVGLQGLSREMWYDEAYTILCYVLPGARFSTTHLVVPNNHVLYSVLLAPLARWHLEPVYRFPSLVAAAVTVWLVGRALRAAVEVSPALRWTTVLAVFAAFPAFLSFSTQIRGYALAIALIAACLSLLVPRPAKRTVLRGVGYSLAGAAAVATVATSLLPLAALALFDIGREAIRGRPRWGTIVGTAAPHGAALAGLGVYVSVWHDLLGNAQRGWGIAGWPLAREVLLALALPLGTLAGAALVWGGAWRAGRTLREASDSALLGLAVAVVGGSVLFAGVRLFPRSFTGFVPLVVVVGVGLAARALDRRPRALYTAALVTAALGQAYWHLCTGVALAEGRGSAASFLLPGQYDARDFDPSGAVTAAFRDAHSGDPVFVDNRDSYCDEMGIYYYAAMAGLERAIVFAPRGLTRLPPPGGLVGAVVVSRDLEGRAGIERALGLRSARWQVLKGSGHFKAWRLVGSSS